MSPPLTIRLSLPKLRSLEQAVSERHTLAAQRKKIILTNGCFDLLHTGHLYFLHEAAKLGDALFVALNSDTSVRTLKGPHRPIQSQSERAFALNALACVHTVLIFDEPRLVREITALRPDLYAKAGDYTLDSLDPAERTVLEQAGTEIRFLPFLPNFSTTALLKRIAAAHSPA